MVTALYHLFFEISSWAKPSYLSYCCMTSSSFTPSCDVSSVNISRPTLASNRNIWVLPNIHVSANCHHTFVFTEHVVDVSACSKMHISTPSRESITPCGGQWKFKNAVTCAPQRNIYVHTTEWPSPSLAGFPHAFCPCPHLLQIQTHHYSDTCHNLCHSTALFIASRCYPLWNSGCCMEFFSHSS